MSPLSPDMPLPLSRFARVAVLSDGEPIGSALVGCLSDAQPAVSALDARNLGNSPNLDYDVVFLTLPWQRLSDAAALLRHTWAGVVTVVCTTSLSQDDEGFFMEDVPEGSVAKLAARLFPASRVVGAFQQFTAEHLELVRLGQLETDIPVVGDDREATDLVGALIDEIPRLESVYVGGLDVAAAMEGLAAVVREVSQDRGSPVGFRLPESRTGLRFLD
jgi:predicted dinucleotide-binding enzyme